MRASNEEALFCDFMQFYGIRGFGTLTVREEAALASSLPPESRSKRARTIGDDRFTFDQLLAVSILDQLRVLNWKMSKSAKRKKDFPEPILRELLYGQQKETEKDEIETFDSGEELKLRLAEIRGETTHG